MHPSQSKRDESQRSHAADARLRGWPLIAGRTVVLAIMAFTIVIGLVALPGLVTHLATPCADALNTCVISPRQVAPLARLGITPHMLALGIAGMTMLVVMLVDGVAAVLLWRRSDEWVALLVAVTLILMPTWLTPGLQTLTGFWRMAAQPLTAAGLFSLALVAGVFPSGHFVPRWLWLPLLVDALISALSGPRLPLALSLILILAAILSLIASQVYRYRRHSTSIQRQQTKWAVIGLVLAMLVNQLFWQTYSGIPALSQADSLYSLLLFPTSFLMIAILAVSFGVAVLRYHLYDIDLIIRRTLIYGPLTGILAALYLVVVLGAQAVAQRLTGQTGQQPVIIVASTLLIAAVFNRLRHRIQALIDRRFYRSRYDAARTVETIGNTLRTETDLAALSQQFVDVVRETMQPAEVSLWLAPARRRTPGWQTAPSGQRPDTQRE